MSLKSFYAQDPILHKVPDLLYSESDFMENLVKFLTENITPPFSLSINGSWGAGKESRAIFEEALSAGENKAGVWYDRACAYALTQRPALALSDLKQAIDLDDYLQKAWDDDDFKSLRELREFQDLVSESKIND